MAAYGYSGRSPSDFEYDHLVSLELGGAVNDPRNLWPESGPSPNPKDSVENTLHRLVCDGRMRLAQAQRIIAGGWAKWAADHATAGESARRGGAAPASGTSAPAASGGPSGTAGVHCRDFATHAAAQQWFVAHGGSAGRDVAGLDRDHDGQACESLP
jgi:hypothetical protein